MPGPRSSHGGVRKSSSRGSTFSPNEASDADDIQGVIRGRDAVLWGILLGFIITYVILFVVPTFLSDAEQMMFFRYVPTTPKQGWVGEDAKSIHYFIASWLQGQDPYTVEAISNSVFYPPMVLVLLSPLAFWGPNAAYLIALWVALSAFVLLSLVIPVHHVKRLTPIVLVFFVTGLFSYPFHFELERGQFNVLSGCLAVLAIFVFHSRPASLRRRLVSYALLSVAIQLKIFPAIFALCLVHDWRQWRQNLKRWVFLGAANLALLFVLGHRIFLAWARSYLAFMGNEIHGEKINHSAASFAAYASSQLQWGGLRDGLSPGLAYLSDHPGWFQALLLATYAVTLVICVLVASRQQSTGVAPPLLLACTLGAIVVPSRSFDYTLALLPAAMAIFMQHVSGKLAPRRGGLPPTIRSWARFALVSMMSMAYFWTTFSYTNKPDIFFLVNNFPALFIMVLLTPLLAIL